MTVKERLTALRAAMEKHGADACVITSEDYHGSEYVGEYFRAREYFSGFTGSAGTLVVTRDEAALRTDGRYFIQAERQLSGSGIRLIKMGQKGEPTIPEYLAQKLSGCGTVAFDGRTVSIDEFKELKEKNEGINFVIDYDIAGEAWENRPPMSAKPVWELEDKYAGETRREKLSKIRDKLNSGNADRLVTSSLDEIAWALNLRGGDVEYNTVFLSNMIIGENEARLFANEKCFSEKIKESLANDGVTLLPYDDFYKALSELSESSSVIIDPAFANCLIERTLAESHIDIKLCQSPIIPLKAVKNPVERENVISAHIKDGAAVTRFMYWLKNKAPLGKLTEIGAAEKLDEFRREGEGYLGQSFDPIMAYGENAAIVHYSATEETNAVIQKRGMLLSDTGGHYYEGTTDITRTFVVGELTEEEKRAFTLVLAGHLELADAVFPKGTRGANLDMLAREPLWKHGLDYNHGTGHGVGYLLNVHEGPQRIHWKIKDGKVKDAVFEPGMITSDEPGVYIAGKFGIRHESLVLCKEREDGMLCFDEITMVPFDLDGIDARYLTDAEVDMLNAYHKRVYETISPLIPEEEREWLRVATREITK